MSQSFQTKHYLVRAVFDWCVDNSLTPYLVVLVNEHTRVPMQHVRDGQIVLNIAPYATNKLVMDAEAASFQARFSGVAQNLYVPMTQVVAIYARENGQGMAFQPGAIAGSGMELGGVVEPDDLKEPVSASPLRSVEAAEEPSPDADGEDPSPEPPPAAPAGKGSHLRRIK